MATTASLTNFKPLPYFDPRTISGCQLWLDAADVNGNGTSVANGASIAMWVDKSGNGRNFTQATSGNRPVYGSFLSYPGISFTGANNTNLSNAYIQTGSGGRNTFIVFYDVNTSANQYGNPVLFYMANTNQSALGDWRAAYDGLNDYLGTDSYGGAYLYRTNPAVTSMRTSRCIGMWGIQSGAAFNTGYVYGNGTQFTTLVNSFATTSALNVTNTGTTSVGGGQTGYVTAVISEVIYYSTDISTADRQKLEGYLAWKWGLQTNLPSNHPFRAGPPSSFAQLTLPAPMKPASLYFDPRTISGCQLWLDAADSSSFSLSGTNISQWRDKSGNGYNTSNLTGTPTYTSNAVNFTGNQAMGTNLGYAASLSNHTMFAITSYTPGFQGAFIETNNTIGNTGCGIDIFVTGGQQRVNGWATGLIVNGATGLTVNTTNLHAFSMRTGTTGAAYIYLDGTQTGSNTSLNFTFTAGGLFSLGNWKNGGSYGDFFTGKINEVLVFSKVLSTTERQQIEGYLAWKWGLQRNLPSNHPFRAGPSSSFLGLTLPKPISPARFLPTQISGCQMWLDAADTSTLTLSNDRVTGWRDKAQGFTVGQVVSGVTAPTYSNAQKGIYFTNPTNGVFTSNVTQGLGVVNPPISVNFSAQSHFTVIQPLAGTSGYAQVFRINTAAGSTFGFLANNANAFPSEVVIDNYAIYTQIYASYLTTTHIRSLNVQSNGHFIYLNGTQGGLTVVNYSSPNTVALTSLSLGGHNDNRSYSGFIFESIYYNRVVTLEERQKIEGYLAWKWGLVANLPSSHPYKLFPPSP